MGNFAITEQLKEAFKKQGITYLEIKNASPDEFFKAIGSAKKLNVHGAFVTQHNIAEYKDEMKLFLTVDNKAGIAVTKDGNIISIFNGGENRGVLKTLLPIAIDNGGEKLDNYNSKKLSSMYEMYGFNPVSKTKFNCKFAPDDWNFERDGEPDIIFWIHNGDKAEDVVLNLGRYKVPWDAVQEFDTYEEAERYRDNLLSEIKKRDTPIS